jgi:elongation factor G
LIQGRIMSSKRLARVRNMGFVAHIDAGKTTVTERVLYYTGKIHRMGEVHDGQATMDWMPQEQERGITITSAVATCSWNNHEIHIIDTPGHVDFTIEVERSLRVLDGAVVILCAVGGVQAQTETVWQQCQRYGIPAVAFINKLDRMGADFESVIKQMNDRLEIKPLPVQLPYYAGDAYKGVVDLIGMRLLVWDDDSLGATFTVLPIPEDMLDAAAQAREHLIETLADFDDGLMETYLSGTDPDEKKIREVLRKVCLDNLILPVFCGSALKNKGIQPLLDAIIDCLPAPDEVKPIVAHDKDTGEEVPVAVASDGPLMGYVFKVYMDEGRRMVYLRLYSGTLNVGQDVYNITRDGKEKIARLFEMHSHNKQRIEKAVAGDIVAAVGLKDSITGDTLIASPEARHLMLEPIMVLKPVISVAIEPKSSESSSKLEQAMHKIMEEDPTIKVDEDPDTGQVILAGMGELHLEITVDRFKTAFGVDINVGKPQVLYCSTVDQAAVAEKVFDKKLGEAEHFGHVAITVKPARRGAGNSFTITPQLPPELAAHIRSGLEEACLSDPTYGYELIDVDVTVDKVILDDRTTAQGLKIASQMALQEAALKSGVVQLEPVMDLDALSPEEYIGDVVGDLSSRKASIEGVEIKGKFHQVKAYVPLSKTFGYSTALRSLTRGRGSFSMRFHGFDKM